MIIKIDMRERDLITVMNDLIKNIPKYNNIKTEILNLELGDIILYDDTSNTNISIIERKTIKDLLSSIKDGRYDEQSYRLNGDPLPNHNIIYMIEGDVMNTRVKSSKGAGNTNGSERFIILSAICSLNYYKGFSVIKTQTITETAMYLCNMYMKIAKEMKTKKPYYIINATDTDKCTTLSGGGNAETNTETSNDNDSNGETNNANNSDNDKDYVRVIKKNKKENITVDNINEIMLCQIPGISATTAIAIMAVHKTIHELIKHLEEDAECLKEIKTEDKNGKTRKLNSTVPTISIVRQLLVQVWGVWLP